jgi:hypothetical protein
MTQVQSNAHRVEIIAPAASALQAAVNAASANSFGSITVGNQLNCDAGGSGNSMFSYSPKMTWNSVDKTLDFMGGAHGNAGTYQRFWLGLYGAPANTWNPNNPPIAVAHGVTANPCHAYFAHTVDTQTGHFYCVNPFLDTGTFNRYRPSTGTWDQPLPVKPGRTAQCAAVEYHPGLYGGQGGLCYGNDAGIWSINLRNIAGGWTLIVDRTNQIDAMGSGAFSVACYSTKDNAVYMGGGGGIRTLWKVPASAGAGSGSQIAACPVDLGTWDDNATTAAAYGSGNSANDMVAITGLGTAYSYNASGNSWTSLGSVVPGSITGAPNREFAFGAIPEYGCIACAVSTHSGPFGGGLTTTTSMFFWKR